MKLRNTWNTFISLEKGQLIDQVAVTFIGGGFSSSETLRLLWAAKNSIHFSVQQSENILSDEGVDAADHT